MAMKKIIKNKKYDTDTATMVGEWESGHDYGDYHQFSEALYKKRTGEYFLYGVGGPLSKYAQSTGNNSWSGGEAIIPLTYDSAREWAEGHLNVDDYEAEFGEVPEDGESDVVISIRVSPAAKAALNRMAAKTGRSKGEILTEALLKLQ